MPPHTLAPGARLGHYEILSVLGAGGMGEVYRARDTKLQRDVAIKVLLPAVADDPDRLARFGREAQVLASLNHPNIAHVHGLEESGSVRALVMELVEGPTLADRIAQGPVPLGEALPIARQIAEALDAAHESGIVHRDLKPANIKVRPDGTVKVLDFGLAKAMDPVGASSVNISMSPTITTPAMTQAGIILGTAAYMSPEQAAGKPVDKRSDLWAFGVVLLEMLTGRRLFDGETVAHVLAAVLTKDPDWSALPADTPAPIRRLLRHSLERDRRRRLADAADARLEIEEALSPTPAEPLAAGPSVSTPAVIRVLPWAVAGVLAVGLLVTLMAPRRTEPPAAMPLRLSAKLGADVALPRNLGASATLSRDGQTLAFVAQKDVNAPTQLYVRRLAQLQATLVPGTEGALAPFFSPDGQWVGFVAGTRLKKVAVEGGAVVDLCEVPGFRGADWGTDGTITMHAHVDSTYPEQLVRVSSAGGQPELLSKPPEGSTKDPEIWPQVLPGDQAVLFTSFPASTSTIDDGNIMALVRASGERKLIQKGGAYGRYLPSGHLVYVRGNTLYAVPFDAGRLELTGRPAPVLQGLALNDGNRGAQYSSSNSGTLTFVPGEAVSADAPILWMDRTGATTPLRSSPSIWSNPRFSPDGSRVTFDVSDRGNWDIWVYEAARDTSTRLTFDATEERAPLWSPDGSRIVFMSARQGGSVPNLYWKRADGSGEVQRMTDSPNAQFPLSWHPSGKFLAFQEQPAQGEFVLKILPVEGNESSGWTFGTPTDLIGARGAIHFDFSPDGRWFAYTLREGGTSQIYVRSFPGPGGPWQISSGRGGVEPHWSRARQELLYSQGNQIMVAPYTVEGNSFHALKAEPWPEGLFGSRPAPSNDWDLHPDGKRVAMAPSPRASANASQDTVVLVFNFFDELRRITGTTH